MNIVYSLFILVLFSLYFYCLHYYRCPHPHPLLTALPCPHLPLPKLPSSHHYTAVCVYRPCIYVLWLITSLSFIQSPMGLFSFLSAVFCHFQHERLIPLSKFLPEYLIFWNYIKWHLIFLILIFLIDLVCRT